MLNQLMTLHVKVLVNSQSIKVHAIYGVWLTTVDAVTICTYPICANFFQSLY